MNRFSAIVLHLLAAAGMCWVLLMAIAVLPTLPLGLYGIVPIAAVVIPLALLALSWARSRRWLRARAVVAALVLAGSALVVLKAAYRERPRLPSDVQLVAFFGAHRSDLDSLRDNCQVQYGFGTRALPPELYGQWQGLIRRLGFRGGGFTVNAKRIFIPAEDWRVHRELGESKGFAWLDSTLTHCERYEVVTDLDAVDARGPARIVVRPLEGNWWLYRQTAGR